MTTTELRAIRTRLNLSQEGLAERLGVDRRTIIRWESGEVAIPTTVVLAINDVERQAELARIIEMQDRRNEMYNMLTLHGANAQRGCQYAPSSSNIGHLERQVSEENAEYERFCDEVRSAQQAYRDRWGIK